MMISNAWQIMYLKSKQKWLSFLFFSKNKTMGFVQIEFKTLTNNGIIN